MQFTELTYETKRHAEATPGTLPPNPRDLSLLGQNECGRRRCCPPPAIPASEPALGLRPRIALSSAQVLPEWTRSTPAVNGRTAPGLILCLTKGGHSSYGYVFYAFGMVVIQAFNGAGDTVTPVWINLFCHWLLQIPMAWMLAKPVGMGPDGVFLSITIAESILAVAGAILFRRGKWKTREI